ncbi:hypothetical protein [Microbulbifer sp. SAOS-129_SWC]|uniref:SRPBCC family protein n=1 Tax=Microbulbifer sp. SAOS-129_SWC TaxID=3145235 RepID=UPI0032163002
MSLRIGVALVLWSLAASAAADVLQQSPEGFTLRLERTLPQRSEQVYAGLAALPRWWNPAHSFSGSAANLSIDLRAGGCFCERWKGGSVEHLHVIAALPGREVRLRGGLGPLQQMPVSGLMQWRLVPQGDKTVLTWEYRVWGSAENQLQRIATAVDGVLAEQLTALAQYLQNSPVAGDGTAPPAVED